MIESAADSTHRAVLALVDFLYVNWDKLLYCAIIVAAAFLLIRLLRSLVNRFGRERELSPGVIGFLNAVIKYCIIFFVAVNILGLFSFTYVYSLLLSLGLIGVVIALGSQTIIANLMGGAIVYLERPFRIGDIIKVGDNTGEVQKISFRSTALRSLDGLHTSVPNSAFLTQSIVNYTRTRSLLLRIPFVLPRSTDVSGLAEPVRRRIADLPGVRNDLDMHVYKAKFTPDNIEYQFHVWVNGPRDSERTTNAVIDAINEFFKK